MGGYPVNVMQLQNIACPAQYQLTHIPWLPVVDRTVTPAELLGPVHFTERQNSVSAHVSSHSNCSIANLSILLGYVATSLGNLLPVF